MAITKQAREQLGATIVGHDGLGQTVRTASGMIKTSRGLIAPASTSKEDTRSGALYEEDEQQLEVVQDKQEIIAPVTPVAAKTTVRKTKKGYQQPDYVRVEVSVEGFGSLPTQYTHVYVGNGVLVLGLNDLSYKPEQAEQTEDGELTHVIKIDKAPGRRYIYCGNSFTDNQNRVNLLLIEIQGE